MLHVGHNIVAIATTFAPHVEYKRALGQGT